MLHVVRRKNQRTSRRCKIKSDQLQQVSQLPQINCPAGWFSFGKNKWKLIF